MNHNEYQEQNSLSRYPFADNSNLTWIGSSTEGELPNNIIIDACVTLFGDEYNTIYLQSIEFNNSDLYLFQFQGSELFSLGVNTYGLEGLQQFSVRTPSGNMLLRVELDVSELRSYFDGLSLSPDVVEFDTSNKLCVSCYSFNPPSVTGVEFRNTTGNNTSEYDILTTLSSGALILSEGANVSLSAASANSANVGVLRGAGLGLYDACPDLAGYVLSVNNTGPDANGNIRLTNEYCYSVTSGAYGLHIKNTCIAPCSAADIINDSHYVNRVTDGITQLATFLQGIKDDTAGLNNVLTSYYNQENTRAGAGNPYVAAQSITQNNSAHFYHTVSVGVYNPGGENTVASLYVTKYSNNISVLSNSTNITVQNRRETWHDIAFTGDTTLLLGNSSIPCGGNTNVSFALRQPLSTNDGLGTENDMLFTVASNSGNYHGVTGGALLNLSPKQFNYNISFKNYLTSDLSKRRVSVQLAFSDTLAPVASLTSLNITYPSYYTVLNSKLESGAAVITYPTAGFVNSVIDYRSTNTYYLLLECDATHNTPGSFTFQAGNTSNSRTRTINI